MYENSIWSVSYLTIFFLKILFVRERASESEHRQTEWKAESEGEAGSLWSKEPNIGLDPRTLGLWPELKAAV